ncbi:ABC transporter permease [Amphritea sp. 1_MG-2023]|uniref:PhnE/PtxC family ABC transporter permease n=1 Tax=Amphritea sp. 1_MG-2023 TaxID=3062670 RepID=UPI0026E3A900|nr:ABC transporter permease [Amphritea sp. 1_MG-2023]MDO6565212.1 ABC transporter permease [Amphritea sp. 1_MG-2023]
MRFTNTMDRPAYRWPRGVRIALWFLLIALACIPFTDLEISSLDPWIDLSRLLRGFMAPQLMQPSLVIEALLATLAFAFAGVGLAVVCGFVLALAFNNPVMRGFCALLRSIHELFWALIFLQFFGLHPLTGLLAIAVPYAGVFARMFAEILDQVPKQPEQTLPADTGYLSALLYTRLPLAWPHLVSYTSYRLECGIRSSAILGFVGLPTLGYYLESSFSQGYYPEVAALLILFYLLVASKKLWLRRWTFPVFIVGSPFFMGEGMPIIWGNVWRFFSQDIVPAPLRGSDASWQSLIDWFTHILIDQALPGVWNTLILSQVALAVTGLFALSLFPLISRHCFSPAGRLPGHLFLVIARSTPEYLLAYILLQLLGPSMLPAVIALAIHNGALIGYLTGRHSNEIQLRHDAPRRRLDRYCYELLPRTYPAFLSFMLYRWEVIMRETAILGVLGIQTIGFFVDSAIQEIRFDVALLLILIAAMMNIFVDLIARRVQRSFIG